MAMNQQKTTTVKNRIASISTKVLVLFVMFLLIILTIDSYGKYVVQKEVVLSVKTAKYYFTAQVEQERYVTDERNNSSSKLNKF